MTPEEKAIERIEKAKQTEKQNEINLKRDIIEIVEKYNGELPKDTIITITNRRNRIQIICT